jgi:hypothetical protein
VGTGPVGRHGWGGPQDELRCREFTGCVAGTFVARAMLGRPGKAAMARVCPVPGEC